MLLEGAVRIDTFEREFDHKKSFCILLFISFIYFFPLILSNSYYVDDNERSLSGLTGWYYLGRPLTDYTYNFLSQSLTGVDIFPLGLLISLLALSYSSYLMIKMTGNRFTLPSICISCMLWMTPFFLQNMSYRFDGMSMSLSVLSCVFAAYCTTNKSLKFDIIAIILIVSCLSMYQPGMSVYLCAIVVSCYHVFLLNDKKLTSLAITILRSSITFILAYLFYSKVILPAINFSNMRSDLIFNTEDPASYLSSYVEKIILILHDVFNSGFQTPALLLFASVIFSLCILIFPSRENRNLINNFFLLIVTLLSLVLLILITFGPTAILKESTTFPRVFMSSGFILLFLLNICSRVKYLSFLTCLTYFVSIFSLSYSYGNATNKQEEYDNLIAYNAISLMAGNKNTAVVFGYNKYTQSVQNTILAKPYLKHIIIPGYDWTITKKMQNYNYNNIKFSFDRKLSKQLKSEICKQSYTPTSEDLFMKIYNIDSYALISLGDFKC